MHRFACVTALVALLAGAQAEAVGPSSALEEASRQVLEIRGEARGTDDPAGLLERARDLTRRIEIKSEPERLGVDGRVDRRLCLLFLAGVEHDLRRRIDTESGVARLAPHLEDVLQLDPRPRYVPGEELEEGLEALGRIADREAVKPPEPRPPEEILGQARHRLSAAKDRIGKWVALAGKEKDEAVAAVLSRAVASLEAQVKELGPAPAESGWPRPVGREEFVWLLRNRHLVEVAPERIAERGRELLAETEKEIEKVVADIYPGKTVDEAIEAMKDEAPTAEELPAIAWRAMTDARDFVIEKELVTVPEDLRKGIVTPVSDQMARTYPFGAYGGFSRVGAERVGVYLVSPGASWMSEEQRRERLRGNHPFKTRVIALHEMWPGHHLQRGYQRRNPNPLRREFYTPVYGEGWALYCEELLYRHGFYKDPRTRLAQLLMRRWRCARVVLDPSLHLGEMAPEEAVDFLAETAGLGRVNAEAEIRRYLGNPTRPFSYIWGWLLIEKLRKECLARGMKEREFHDRLLEAGPIPIPLVRELIRSQGKTTSTRR